MSLKIYRNKYNLETLAHMVLQSYWVTPCDKPVLTAEERRDMVETALDCSGTWTREEMENGTDEYLTGCYLHAMAEYVNDII
jgi:molybdopterin-guanine dinucleotide biosynthesis protein A